MVDIATKFPLGAAPYGGLLPPVGFAGEAFYPYGFAAGPAAFSLTANLMYLAPFPVFRTTTFAGMRIRDSGAGNNLMNVRVGVYSDGATYALSKDIGSVGLTGTPGVHSISSAYTLTPGIYWLALVSDNTPTMVSMATQLQQSSAGYMQVMPLQSLLGDFGASAPSILTAMGAQVLGKTQAFTYGALPSTVTPTATLNGNITTGIIPAMMPFI